MINYALEFVLYLLRIMGEPLWNSTLSVLAYVQVDGQSSQSSPAFYTPAYYPLSLPHPALPLFTHSRHWIRLRFPLLRLPMNERYEPTCTVHLWLWTVNATQTFWVCASKTFVGQCALIRCVVGQRSLSFCHNTLRLVDSAGYIYSHTSNTAAL